MQEGQEKLAGRERTSARGHTMKGRGMGGFKERGVQGKVQSKTGKITRGEKGLRGKSRSAKGGIFLKVLYHRNLPVQYLRDFDDHIRRGWKGSGRRKAKFGKEARAGEEGKNC